jgi:hypothetical protein
VSKRVILRHVGGRFAGLWQIVGTDDELPKAKKAGYPASLPKLQFIDHVAAAALQTVKPRYVLYREVGV